MKPYTESEVLEIFDYLHAHPEISWQEVDTTNYIAELLRSRGLQPKLFKEMTGLYVDIGIGEPTVGLRTDIDALWQPVGNIDKANHSCGHDGHMTIALATIDYLQQHLPEEAAVRVIFQPAEEKGLGAIAVSDTGILNNLRYLYGVHLRPIQDLEDDQYSPALHHGAAVMLEGVIIGEEAHGARPHLGKNAIEIGSSIVEALRAIHIDPMIPSSIKMTKFQAGGQSTNIIPGYGEFSIDMRAQTNEGITALMSKFELAIQAVSMQYNCKITTKLLAEVAAAEVDAEACAFLRQAIKDVAGEQKLSPEITTTGGEDFHFYTLKNKQLKATMLGVGCNLLPGLHHPDMTFNTRRLITGAKILGDTVVKTIIKLKKEAVLHEGNHV